MKKLLAVVLVLVLIFAAFALSFKSINPADWYKDIKDKWEDESGSEPGTDTGGITDDEGNVIKSGSKLPAALMFSASYPMDTQSSGTALTATITPSTAVNKKVDWVVAFAKNLTAEQENWRDNIEVAGGKATDYVTATPTSDGSLTATLSCIEAFGAQIKITVTSRDNSEASASCVCDYQQRVTDLSMTLSTTQSKSYTIATGPTKSLTLTAAGDTVSLANIVVTPKYSNYTVATTYTKTIKYQSCLSMITLLKTKGLTISAPSPITLTSTVGMELSTKELFNKCYGLSTLTQQNTAVNTVLDNLTTPIFSISVTLAASTANYATTISVYGSTTAFTYSVTGISLDPGTIVF